MKHDLTHLSGCLIRDEHYPYDNETCYNIYDIIKELEKFVAQYDTCAMNEHALYKQGKKAAYLDVVDYLKRIRGVE